MHNDFFRQYDEASAKRKAKDRAAVALGKAEAREIKRRKALAERNEKVFAQHPEYDTDRRRLLKTPAASFSDWLYSDKVMASLADPHAASWDDLVDLLSAIFPSLTPEVWYLPDVIGHINKYKTCLDTFPNNLYDWLICHGQRSNRKKLKEHDERIYRIPLNQLQLMAQVANEVPSHYEVLNYEDFAVGEDQEARNKLWRMVNLLQTLVESGCEVYKDGATKKYVVLRESRNGRPFIATGGTLPIALAKGYRAMVKIDHPLPPLPDDLKGTAA